MTMLPVISASPLVSGDISGTTPFDLSNADYIFVGEDAYDESGSAVASAGDVDGDGLDDLLIGAGYADNDGLYYVGRSYLVLGSSLAGTTTIELASADYIFVGEGASANAGLSLQSAGDVDGDGLADILIAPRVPANDSEAGKAYLILRSSLGTSGSLIWRMQTTFTGESDGDWAGQDVASAGDVDGDGLDDILVGAHRIAMAGRLGQVKPGSGSKPWATRYDKPRGCRLCLCGRGP